MRNSRKNTKGFTLVEIMIALFATAIIMAALSQTFMSGTSFYELSMDQIELQSEMRKAVERLKQDIRQTDQDTLALPADNLWYKQIALKAPQGVINKSAVWTPNLITYSLNAKKQTLMRQTGAQSLPLALYIKTIEFRRKSTNPGTVEILVEGEKKFKGVNLTESYQFEVTMRN